MYNFLSEFLYSHFYPCWFSAIGTKDLCETQKQGVHMTFEKETVELGRNEKGINALLTTYFTNTGTEVIEIEIVSGCDCTTLDWTRKPIKPGEKGKVNVIFDSKEKRWPKNRLMLISHLKNKDPKTNSQILKILNYTFELYK